MIATAAAVQGLIEAQHAIFQNAFDAAEGLQGIREALATPVVSKALIERHNILGSVPKMRNVTGQPVILEDLNRFSFTIENAEFAAGIEVRKLDIEADQLTLIPPRLAQLAQESSRHEVELILNSMASPGTAFDGTAFFSDTRTIGDSANIDNKIGASAATTTKPTPAELQIAISTARASMRVFQDDKGRPMNLIPDTIVVPAHMEQPMFQALLGTIAPGVVAPVLTPSANGVTKVGGYTLICNPFLSITSAIFYMFHTTSQVKPWIAQTLVPTEIMSTGPESDTWVREFKIAHVVRAVRNVGTTDPRFGLEITLT